MRVQLKYFLMVFLLIAAVPYPLPTASAQENSRTYHIRKDDSHIGFSIMKWVVFKEEGRFRDFRGTIAYDEKNPSAIKVDITVQTTSVDSRNEGRDNALRSHDFFHVSKFPSMTFTSVRAASRGKDTIEVTGDFTLLGKTRRITVPVRINGISYVRDFGHLVGFEASFVLDRTEFGMTRGLHFIGKEATIHLMIGAATGGGLASR